MWIKAYHKNCGIIDISVNELGLQDIIKKGELQILEIDEEKVAFLDKFGKLKGKE